MISELISTREGVSELCIPRHLLSPDVDAALALAQQGRLPDAMNLLQRDFHYEGLNALVSGGIFGRGGELDAARQCYLRACEDLEHPLVLDEAARFHSALGERFEAVALRRRALALDPHQAQLCANLGEDLVNLGQQQEGLELLQRAVTLAPDHAVIRSMWLSCLHYGEDLEGTRLFEEHRVWGTRQTLDTQVMPDNSRDPNRVLRIGYVSPDFCRHSVACFLEPLLEVTNPDNVQTFGYGNVPYPDEVTERLKGKLVGYRDIHGLDDDQAAAKIRADGIDILVDLCGHFRGHRLGIFARKPAPVQVTYLGYPDTTGLPQIDYRLTDPWADSEGSDPFYTEQLWRLADGFLCFRPPHPSPPVGDLPFLRNGHITFGSFNHNAKITDTVLNLWAQVLQKLPQSRLILKFKGGAQPALREHYLLAWERLGIDRRRIEILGWQPDAAHLELYNRIDLALDTYPYHGTTTTCEALWMGVPTISLVGQHHASRVGWSLLSRVGLEIFAAHSAQEYVDKAVSFGGQPEALATIRRSLRQTLLASPLCDAQRVAGGIENAYRAMWREWIDY